MAGSVVIVKQGWLRGTTVANGTDGSYVSFKGIPYAAPPVGNLRFADPRPALSWTGIRDALQEGPKCPQYSLKTPEVLGEEDCLYLNVNTKSLKGSRPVMVWIHGGALVIGDGGSNMYSPDYLMKTDIVLVSINYRLGVLGFLNLDHEVATGNMGLKDQVEALKWVKENIAQFGGDPNNVTIFGESAGGASVHYLLLSPLAKGLFHKAILQSGVALNPWAYLPMPDDYAHRYVSELGKDTTDPHEMIEYLRGLPVHRLIEVQAKIRTLEDRVRCMFSFRPNVDTKSQEPFLPRSPQELVAEGVDIPLLIGYNSLEGSVFFMDLTEENLTPVNEYFDVAVTQSFIDEASPKVHDVAMEIRNFYLGDKMITKETFQEFIQCFGDVNFTMGIQRVIESQRTKKTPTFFYKFTHDSPKSFGKIVFSPHIKGAAHGDDLSYLFYMTMFGDALKMGPDSIEQTVSDRLVRMWTNFAKTGNPTPEIDDLITVKWEPITRTTKNCLIIGKDLSLDVNPDEDVFELCKRIQDIVGSQ